MKGDNYPPTIHTPQQPFTFFDLHEGYDTEQLLDFLGIPPRVKHGDRDGGYDTLPTLHEIRSIEIHGQPHFLLIHWPLTKARPTDAEIRARWAEEYP